MITDTQLNLPDLERRIADLRSKIDLSKLNEEKARLELESGKPELWQSSFQYLADHGCNVFYLSPIRLNFITVNPF